MTLSIEAAGAWTWVYTTLIDTGQVQSTVRVDGALWSTLYVCIAFIPNRASAGLTTIIQRFAQS